MKEWIEATPEAIREFLATCSGRGGIDDEGGALLSPYQLRQGWFEISGTHGAMIAQCVRKLPDAVLLLHRSKDPVTGKDSYWAVRFRAEALRGLSGILLGPKGYSSRIARKEGGS